MSPARGAGSGAAMWLALCSAMAFAQDVDLAKHAYGSDNAWPGKPVAAVLPPESIERIILARAMTSAPAALDMDNIRRMLDTDAVLVAPSQAGLLASLFGAAREAIWEAVLLTRTGEAVRFVAGNEWACILGVDGAGCFRMPAP